MLTGNGVQMDGGVLGVGEINQGHDLEFNVLCPSLFCLTERHVFFNLNRTTSLL